MALKGQVITNSYDGRYYVVKWTATQNKATNTSRIDWQVEALGGASSWYAEYILRVYIDGGAAVFSKTTRSERYKGIIASGSKTLSHNNDGDKSFKIKIEAAAYLASINLTGNETFTLDKIGRNSTINSIPDFDVESGFAITLTESASAKAYTMDAFIGSKLIRTWSTVTSGSSYQFTSSEIDEIYKALPNSKQGTLSFKLKTYSDTSKSNQIGSIHTRDATITLTKGASCGLLVAADDVVAGAMVAGISRPIFSITDAVPSPHATIKSYYIKVEGFFDVNRQEYESGTIPSGITEMVVAASVTDSRGNVARATRTLRVLPYSAPSIGRFEIYRSNANGQADPSGTYVRAHMQAGASPLEVDSVVGNSIEWKLYSKVRGTTSWGNPISTGTAATALDVSRTNSGYSAADSYDFKLEIIDKYNTTISLGVLSTAGYTMSWSQKGVGIGKVLEQGTLDIGGDTYINDNTIHSSKNGEFWNHTSDDVSGWMAWHDDSQELAKVGILTPNNEKFSIVSAHGEIELDSRDEITLISGGKSAVFSNGVFLPVQESTFPLYNNWRRRTDFDTAKAIKTVDGMVHLQGLIEGGTKASGTQMARLPVGMRPAKRVVLTAWNADGTIRRYDIYSDGYMKPEGAAAGGDVVPLNGMSFYAGE